MLDAAGPQAPNGLATGLRECDPRTQDSSAEVVGVPRNLEIVPGAAVGAFHPRGLAFASDLARGNGLAVGEHSRAGHPQCITVAMHFGRLALFQNKAIAPGQVL